MMRFAPDALALVGGQADVMWPVTGVLIGVPALLLGIDLLLAWKRGVLADGSAADGCVPVAADRDRIGDRQPTFWPSSW